MKALRLCLDGCVTFAREEIGPIAYEWIVGFTCVRKGDVGDVFSVCCEGGGRVFEGLGFAL